MISKKGIAFPEGFQAAGIAVGIKKNKKEDLVLIYSEAPCNAAGTFTTNKLTAWPLQWSKKVISFSYHHAILASSGNANCFNGDSGKKTIQVIARDLAKILDAPEESVLIAQTGVIGEPFPIQKIKAGLPRVYAKLSGKGTGAAKGIMTTDTKPKECALSFKQNGKIIKLGSIAKGSGMIYPNMATMFAFITTDINISKKLLTKLVKKATNETFNRMSIDNDTSTNDCVFVLANGLAGNRRIKTEKDAKKFYEALITLCKKQCIEMVKDGEGVTKVCEIKIRNAKTVVEADKIARQIANSMLFKTMLPGADPNWGRVAAAIGATGVAVDFGKIEIGFDNVSVLKRGVPQVKNINKARKVLNKSQFCLQVDLKRGKAASDFITSDLTKKYVEINSEYTT